MEGVGWVGGFKPAIINWKTSRIENHDKIFGLGFRESTSSRKALAAVCAADSAGHTAHRSSMQAFARWPALLAALTAASALRLEGQVVCAKFVNPVVLA